MGQVDVGLSIIVRLAFGACTQLLVRAYTLYYVPFELNLWQLRFVAGCAFLLSRFLFVPPHPFSVIFSFARDFLARGAAFFTFFLLARPFGFFVFRVRFAFFFAALLAVCI